MGEWGTNLVTWVVKKLYKMALMSNSALPAPPTPAANSTVTHPTVANPTVANPTVANPTVANPAVANPAATDPTASDSYVKLAMRNMVRKRGMSLVHFSLTTIGLLAVLVGLAYLTR